MVITLAVLFIIYEIAVKENIKIYEEQNETSIINSEAVESNASSKGEKIIYLTFDDGPCDVTTEKILDVLKKDNVKATFFVVGKEIKNRENTLKRINNEGHGIGLHTYSHNFKKIYKSHDEFIKEMIETDKLVYRITGIKSKILRFPGGSHNRLNSRFLNEIHAMGYKVFDWTHSCEDGTNPKYSPYKLYQNSLKKIISRKKAPGVILLMHCNKRNINTVKALPLIIKHYKNEGYEFKVINKDTPEYYSE